CSHGEHGSGTLRQRDGSLVLQTATVYVALWVLVTLVGIECLLMGRRVFTDDEWEAGDWWALDRWIGAWGVLFTFLFPITRGPRKRESERVNAVLVMVFGLAWVVAGLTLLVHELR